MQSQLSLKGVASYQPCVASDPDQGAENQNKNQWTERKAVPTTITANSRKFYVYLLLINIFAHIKVIKIKSIKDN